MYVDRILFPVTALGPGERIAIWLAGCHRHCEGCANPELWEHAEKQMISVNRLVRIIRTIVQDKSVYGLTITGGEPFEQSEELLELLKAVNDLHLNTLVFSGYRLEELQQGAVTKDVLMYVDVLIDGEYVKELNDGVQALRGSKNQRIHFLSRSCYDDFYNYMQEGRKIQNFVYGDTVLSVGIHSEDEAKG